MSGAYYCISNHPLGSESACQHCQAYVTARYQYWSLDPTQSQYNYNTESTASVKGAVRAFDSDGRSYRLPNAGLLLTMTGSRRVVPRKRACPNIGHDATVDHRPTPQRNPNFS